MRKSICQALTATLLLWGCTLLPNRAEATTFHAGSAAAAAIESITTVEKTVCRLYPYWYPRRWAVYASAWPCYPYYSYYYYPYHPYVGPGFIHRRY